MIYVSSDSSQSSESSSSDDDNHFNPNPSSGSQNPRRNPDRAVKGRGPNRYGFEDNPYYHICNYYMLMSLPYEVADTCKDIQARRYDAINQSHELDGFINGMHPFTFAAKANEMDVTNYWQAMHLPDYQQFIDAMDVEWNALLDLDAWEVIDR